MESKSSYILKLLLNVQFCYACIVECNIPFFDVHKITQKPNFYQITIFISDNLKKTPDFKLPSYHGFPIVTYSFNSNNQEFSNETTKRTLKGAHALQKSLVIFYTINIEETVLFNNFLIP